ncbi:MAG: metal-dependent hydrolase [Candidatus Bathyarchaeia archaeon]
MALAYLLCKPTAKWLKMNLNIPLIFVLSIIPDVDIVVGALIGMEIHRGPMHSVIAALLVFIPFFVAYRKKAVPYFLALVSHSLIGDFFIGGQLQLFWPVTQAEFGFHELGIPWGYIDINSTLNIAIELTLFAGAVVLLAKTKDFRQFFQNKKSNLILAIPIFTVLLPTFAGYPLTVPLLMIPAHLFYLILFSVSVLIALVFLFRTLLHRSR